MLANEAPFRVLYKCWNWPLLSVTTDNALFRLMMKRESWKQAVTTKDTIPELVDGTRGNLKFEQ